MRTVYPLRSVTIYLDDPTVFLQGGGEVEDVMLEAERHVVL